LFPELIFFNYIKNIYFVVVLKAITKKKTKTIEEMLWQIWKQICLPRIEKKTYATIYNMLL